ncbi:MAG: peptidylprolyl isomerase, partial [Actinomycetota bacterium]|nr:peptidylprolyl isomerase [Actinomycetota bacterium]
DAQREFLVERQAVIGTWIENPTAAEMEPFRGRYEQGSQASGVVCLSIIAAPSRADAESPLQDFDGTPEGFAELARANSADESGQNGGSIGCQPFSQLSSAPDLAEAVVTTEIGSVAGPLQLGEQFYLIYIQPFEVARSGLGGVFAGERFSALAADAEVYVDPRYGRFDPEAVGVEPLGPRDTGLVPPGE